MKQIQITLNEVEIFVLLQILRSEIKEHMLAAAMMSHRSRLLRSPVLIGADVPGEIREEMRRHDLLQKVSRFNANVMTTDQLFRVAQIMDEPK